MQFKLQNKNLLFEMQKTDVFFQDIGTISAAL